MTHPNLTHIIIGALIVVSPGTFAGDITGTITFKGTPPANPEVKDFSADPGCSKLVTNQVTMPMYRVGSGGELADVFVTLKGLSGKSTGAGAEPVVLDQKGCQYIPYILAIQTGQTLLVRNSDPLMHSVHPTPSPGGGNKDKGANLVQLPGAEDLKFVFTAEEKFLRFKCDVHPWMFAYVCVADHPYFALSGVDGRFKIKDVPPGNYIVEASHRKAGTLTKDIEVKEGAVTLDFIFELK